ncbi:MAG: dihydropteroate synthase [Candidatus Cloacimonetes bacterium]|nr:dihydropteroate synthase [Candidatus Cloacimonadota bacterium]
MNRILSIKNPEDIIEEFKKIGVTSQGIDSMYPKAGFIALKLKNIKTGAANIIKQNMLSLGGDAAVARGVVNGKVDRSDVIILGTIKNINNLIKKLSYQKIFEIPEICKSIEHLLKLETNQKERFINARGHILPLNRTLIMGILNVSPDSFYDGGRYTTVNTALMQIEKMINEGADIIDIGGQSTRPYAKKISIEEELSRVMPVIEKVIEKFYIPFSIDTYKSEIAKTALNAGVHIVNDISGLRFDKKMAPTIAQYPDVPLIIMHIKGTPRNMQDNPSYEDVIEEILEYFTDSIKIAINSGIKEENIIIDPGIGFGKRLEDNVKIINKISEFRCLGKPILLGCSNKSFIGKILKVEKDQRLEGTLAANAYAILNGVNIIRVHEVAEHKKLLQMLDYLKKG